MPSLKEMLAAKAAKAAKPATKQHGPLAEEPRTLGSTEKGADVPFEFASEKPSEAAKQWLAIRHQPETTLGIVVALDLSGETTAHAWLALESPADPGRLLYLYRLPLLAPKSDAGPF